MGERYDYIVAGGGSAGCVVAARLVKEANARVLIVEAGYSHRHALLDMPPGIFKMINDSKYMRYHKTVPQDHLGGRVHSLISVTWLGADGPLAPSRLPASGGASRIYGRAVPASGVSPVASHFAQASPSSAVA